MTSHMALIHSESTDSKSYIHKVKEVIHNSVRYFPTFVCLSTLWFVSHQVRHLDHTKLHSQSISVSNLNPILRNPTHSIQYVLYCANATFLNTFVPQTRHMLCMTENRPKGGHLIWQQLAQPALQTQLTQTRTALRTRLNLLSAPLQQTDCG
jgi:hypothetical protein